ncbi:hypothetical protein [Microcystis sp. M113S1]|nr:hypothetical protein [Microcystis sp. M113S1]
MPAVHCSAIAVEAMRSQSCMVRSLMWLLPLQRSIFGERTMHID